MFLVGLPNKDSPEVGIGRVREKLASSKVRMKANKESHKNGGLYVEGEIQRTFKMPLSLELESNWFGNWVSVAMTQLS